MYLLNQHRRPRVTFDANNREHRQYAALFVRSNSWAACPYEFVVPGSLITAGAIQRILLNYYAEQELNEIAQTAV